jgi:hypothetical protein
MVELTDGGSKEDGRKDRSGRTLRLISSVSDDERSPPHTAPRGRRSFCFSYLALYRNENLHPRTSWF